MLYEKNRAKSDMEFLAMLAHDMKTPVKAQIQAMKLLTSGKFGKFNKKADFLILNILASNKYLQSLLDNVLSDYRINKGNFILRKEPLDIRKTIEDSIKNIGILSEIKGQKIIVKYLTDDFIKNYDDIEIQRVIINFLSNAIEYSSENGEIKLTVAKNSKKLQLTVESEIKINLTCEKKDIYSAHNGLGLIICARIIEAHGGEIIKTIKENSFSVSFLLP